MIVKVDASCSAADMTGGLKQTDIIPLPGQSHGTGKTTPASPDDNDVALV